MEEKKSNVKAAGNAQASGSATTKLLDAVIFGSIFLVFLMSPLFFTGVVAQGIGFEKMVLFYFLVLIGSVAWVTKGVVLGELNIKRTPLDIPILSILVIFAISTLLSVSGKDSLIGAYGSSAKGLFSVFIYILFYYLIINNLTADKIKKLFFTIVFSSSLVAIHTLLQLKGIYILPQKFLGLGFTHVNSFNSLGSLSGLTRFLGITFPLMVIAATQIKKIFPDLNKTILTALKVYLSLSIIVSLAVLSILTGFTGWIIMIVGMVIVLMFLLAKIIKVDNNNLIIPLLSFLVVVILFVMGNNVTSGLNLPAEISLSRGASWDIAKNSLKENPLLGSGPSTFAYNFSKYKDLSFNSSVLWNVRFDSASVSVFELLSTVGVLGALAVVILTLISLSISFLTLIKTRDTQIDSILLATFASFVIAVSFSLFFSLNNSVILVTIILSIFAVASALIMYPEKFQNIKLSFRASPKYALALAAIFLCVSAGVVVLSTVGLKMYMGDMYAKKAMASGDVATKINNLSKAVSLADYQDSYYLSLANAYMSLANKHAIDGNDKAEVGANLSLAIESGKKAVDIAENRVGNNESLALIYENASFYTRGALQWAEDHYMKVIELDPNNPTPYLRIALVNMARANAESDTEEKKYYINEAVKKYDEAIKKKGDLAAAYYGKGVAHEKLGENDDAIEQLRKANLTSRDNVDYRFELGRLYFNRGIAKFDLSQGASQEIAVNDITPGTEGDTETLSVQPSTGSDSGKVESNPDLVAAEQIFLSILNNNKNHANARYSLAVLYQKVGNNEKARIMVNSLLDTVKDPKTQEAIQAQFQGL
jgi:tetratricopeptide (TPR) repeat protein